MSEPDLPCPSLAELQRQARAAGTDEAVREVGRLFKDTLESLCSEERQLLLPPAPSAALVAGAEQESPALAAVGRGREAVFLAAVAAALAELPDRFATVLTPPEEIEAELIRRAGERLAEIDQRVAEDGLTVSGSQRQLRPHPLLGFEAGLRRELIANLRQLEFRVQNRAMIERMRPRRAQRQAGKTSSRSRQEAARPGSAKRRSAANPSAPPPDPAS